MKFQLNGKLDVERIHFRLILEREGDSRNSLPGEGKIRSSVLDSFLKRWKDMSESRNKAKYGFGEYHPYNDILSWLGDIEYFYPQMAQVFTIGITYEGRHIKGIKACLQYISLNFSHASYLILRS